jgi:phage tail sheath gpL-like
MPISTAVDASAVARTLGIATNFINTNVGGVVLLPQRLAVVGQGASASVYATDKVQLSSASAVGATFGYGSPLHLAALQLLPVNGDGVGSIPVTFYPLEDDGSGVPSAGDITPTAGPATKAGAFSIVINGISSTQFVIAVGDDLATVVASITAAVNGVLDMPMIAVDGAGIVVDLTSKWAGLSANGLSIVVDGPTDTGFTFAVTQPTGGLVNPTIDAALTQFGNVWETMVLNCLDIQDDIALDAFDVFGTGRWGALTRKPLIVFTGHTLTTPNAITAITDLRKTDRTNVALPNPGSVNLPFVSAAGELARIIKVANNDPAWDYGRQPVPYIQPGADGVQWTYPERDQAVKGGASTIEVRDGVVSISDTVTMYHPDGESNPAYRFVKDIVALQNVIFNVDLIFNTTEGWQSLKDSYSIRATSLAIISDPAYSKANTQAQIDTQNPNRLNIVYPVKVGGNANIISVDLNFGFFFGTATVI